MQITPDAREKLHELEDRFRHGEHGFHFGKIGACRGALPRLKPAKDPRPGERPYEYDGVTLYMTPAEHRALDPYTLDYRKGLLLHRFTLEADCNACTALSAC